MRHVSLLLLLLFCAACNESEKKVVTKTGEKPDSLYARYWEERAQLFPLDATASGDYRYNDRMTITIASSFRDSLRRFYRKYQSAIGRADTSGLDAEGRLSYRLFHYEMDMGLEGLRFPSHYLPFNQFWGLTLDLPLLGSGAGNQPFRTPKDYDDFLKRLAVFPAWTDTAIANMREGMTTGWVLPGALVVKILPQLKAMLAPGEQNTFYGAVRSMPDSFSAAERSRIKGEYLRAIDSVVRPSYRRLYDFLGGPYLSRARSTSGIGELPGGADYYHYLIRSWTTTGLKPDSVYRIGLAEVARIEHEMIGVMNADSGFQAVLKGDRLNVRIKLGVTGAYSRDTALLHGAYFSYLNTDPQFFPFRTPQQVLDSFRSIKKTSDPALEKLFNQVPRSPFTIRQTEAFRAASASAEYNPPSEDGSRPGIFYVPIPDARRFNAIGMETLFLHEAIPGHHYQIALQQENKALPRFRRFSWYGAYGEGWALYSESLGKELGLFTNPYQYFGHLSDAMHRAIRLVVDAGLHSRGMSREQAIEYMMAHEQTTEEAATAEVERYMAIPGQALSYKIGQLAIRAERDRYAQQLGGRFSPAAFHDQVLGSGCLPLNLLSEKLQAWARTQ